MAAESAIEVRGLRHSYGDRVILNGVDLTVEVGKTLVILGGSGSGKSTLLRCMVGLERPDEGSVSILGRDLCSAAPEEVAELRQRIGMAFQSGALFGSMTVGENVDLPLAEFTDLPDSTRDIIIRIKLALVGLDDAVDLHPSELSGGMKKRAAFARAMALDPEVLFCDEPSAGLDPVTAAGLDRLLNQLKEVFGVTIVVVTHELDSAFAVADRLALLHQGRVLISGTPQQVRECPHPIVQGFLRREPEEQPEHGERFREWMTEAEEAVD
ncbi:MAG: ABC transporter ATP-binding protein [bacterium]|nr:ABC transporter ATP-binding protein [bacterium]